MTLTITHSHAEGTLIDGTAKGDGTAEVLKANGWRWGRSISQWYMTHTRDRLPKTWKITRTADALRAAGFDVEVAVEDGFRPTAEVEADKVARQEDRVAGLEDRAQRLDGVSDALDQRASAMSDMIPFGQPILVGHHSEGRHRRDLAKINSLHDKAHVAYEAEREARARADTASHTTDARYSVVGVANRIEALAAEMRGYQRLLDGSSHNFGGGYVETHDPLPEGGYRDRTVSRLAEVTDKHGYWVAVRVEQVATGKAGDYSKDTVSKGDMVLIRGECVTVNRVNAKTVTVPWGRFMPGTHTAPYAEIKGHRTPEAVLNLDNATAS